MEKKQSHHPIMLLYDPYSKNPMALAYPVARTLKTCDAEKWLPWALNVLTVLQPTGTQNYP